MREYYRKKLNKLLGAADDEEFIQLLWSTHALQSDYAESALGFIRPETIPDGAVTTKMISPFFIQKWEIETLANELMTVPKSKTMKNGGRKTLRCDNFNSSLQCAELLRKLENLEYRIQKKPEDILIETGRIAARQFDWQRGYVNIPQFYRNSYIYGQGDCASYFEETYGISINRFSEIGFILFVSFTKHPAVMDADWWSKIGVRWEEVERVLTLIALPFSKAAYLARKQRKHIIHTADKPSILRQAPCLRFGKNGDTVRAPLPELILERVTSGLFYDVVNGGGHIRDEYGRRFEDYCARYLSDSLPDFEWEREFSYRKKPSNFATPDLLCNQSGKTILAFECKAARMSHGAMFGKDPMEAGGYQDIIKAVFQLWRFFSHCRRGIVERKLDDEAVGIVLTLDNWLVLAEKLRQRVLEGAMQMAHDKDPDIIDEDRRPITFVAVEELERTLSIASEGSFRHALIRANTEQFKGWRLDSIIKELLKGSEHETRDYPYASDLGALLPWWEKFNGDGAT